MLFMLEKILKANAKVILTFLVIISSTVENGNLQHFDQIIYSSIVCKCLFL